MSENKRRNLLKTIGIAGGAVAASTLLGPLSASAAVGRHNVLNVARAADLSSLTGLENGDIVFVGGHTTSGDGGEKIMRWVSGSSKTPDGGMVLAHSTNTTGKFEIVHDGVGDYRWYGIFGDTTAADSAFDAMAANTSIHTIEAHTDLKFLQRHVITRSDLTLDFRNHKVSTTGIANATAVNRIEVEGLFLFTGATVGNALPATLSAAINENVDAYTVPSSLGGTVGGYVIMSSDKNPSLPGTSAKEIMRMARIVAITGTSYRLDYRASYTIASGRSMTYQLVNPIKNITVKNMVFYGSGGTADADLSGCHPVTFYYGVNCNAINIESNGNYAAAISRYYNNDFVTDGCSAINALSIRYGGRGYLTQQMYCNKGVVKNCSLKNGRHLVDSTATSNILVENCYVTFDVNGGFVTHGQFEHDLTFIGNVGNLSLAGSGETWGASAKNVVVKKHTGANINVGLNGGSVPGGIQNYGNRITNVTLEDCHVVADTGVTADANRVNGCITVTCDGASVKNCSADKMLYLNGRTQLSKRPNVFEGCTFDLTYDEDGTSSKPFLTMMSQPSTPEDLRIKLPVIFKDCTFRKVANPHFFNNAPVYFENCTFEGRNTAQTGMEFFSHTVSFKDCRFNNIGIILRTVARDADGADSLGATAVQKLSVKGCVFTGATTNGAISIDSEAAVPAVIDIEGTTYSQGASAAFISNAAVGKLLALKMRNCVLDGGKTVFTAGDCAKFCHITNNYFSGHTIENPPTAVIADNSGTVTGITI